jgi:hypothetical protein
MEIACGGWPNKYGVERDERIGSSEGHLNFEPAAAESTDD